MRVRRSVRERLHAVRLLPSARCSEPRVPLIERIRAWFASAFVALQDWLRLRREKAWVLAAATGTVGVILTLLLQFAGAASTGKMPLLSASAGTPRKELPPSRALPSEPVEKLVEKPVELPAANLLIEVREAVMPDRNEQFLVTSTSPRARLRRPAGLSRDVLAWVPFRRQPVVSADETGGRAFASSEVGWDDDVEIGRSTPVVVPSEEKAAAPVEAGPKDLDVTVEKILPEAAPMGEPYAYEIVVRNAGGKRVERVIVEEQLPESFLLADVEPAGVLDARVLRWELERLDPGEATRLKIRLKPGSPGPAHAATRLQPAAVVTADTVVGQAQIQLKMTLPRRVPLGRDCPIDFAVTNVGSTAAEGVVLRTDLPGALSYRNGRSLDYVVGSLSPGETRTARLVARAERTGTGIQRAELVTGGVVVQETERTVRVTSETSRSRRAVPRVCCPCSR